MNNRRKCEIVLERIQVRNKRLNTWHWHASYFSYTAVAFDTTAVFFASSLGSIVGWFVCSTFMSHAMLVNYSIRYWLLPLPVLLLLLDVHSLDDCILYRGFFHLTKKNVLRFRLKSSSRCFFDAFRNESGIGSRYTLWEVPPIQRLSLIFELSLKLHFYV